MERPAADSLFLSLESAFILTPRTVETLIREVKAGDPGVSLGVYLKNSTVPKAYREQVAARIINWFTSNDEEREKIATTPKSDESNLGEDLTKALAGQNFTDICLLLADGDVARARVLYDTEDFEIVSHAYKNKANLINAQAKIIFETAVAVMGGGEDSKNPSSDKNTKVFDFTKPNAMPNGLIGI